MQSVPSTAPSDFVAAFAAQRQRLLKHAGSLLIVADDAGRSADRVPKLAQYLAASLEQLKVAEEALRQQRLTSEATAHEQERVLAYFKALFHEAPTPLFLTTTDGSIRAVNAAGAQLVTGDVYRLEGKPFAALVPAVSRAEFRHRLALLVETGGATSFCFTLLRKTDIPIRVEASVTLVPASVVGTRAFYWNVRPIEDPPNRERPSSP